MCGLAGFLTRAALAPGEAEARARTMAESLVHRGPDDGGTWIDAAAGIALAHRRLSIIDLSSAGAQPMVSACGRYVLAFNGEIYNFRSLRRDLERPGAVFRGHSDTEVLLAAFGAWGVEATLVRADGMFAIALWDRLERRLVLARDRIGEKPLYYGWSGATFLFASELKALRTWPDFRARVSRDVVAAYLRHNYVPDPYCVHPELRKLAPGTWVELDTRVRGLPAPRAYWSLAETITAAARDPLPDDAAAAADRVEATLRDAARSRMVADVPLGAFLSGGIDSSLVVAMMQAHGGAGVRTFSIGFEDRAFDEAPYAAAVAAHLGTEHTELYVRPEEARAVIPELPTVYDEPFADSSQIPTLLVSRLARGDVTVAMSGDAGDELFAGYTRYSLAHDLWARARRTPTPVRRAMAAGLLALSPRSWDGLFAVARPLLPRRARHPNVGDKLHKLARLLGTTDPLSMYSALISLWPAPSRVVPGAEEPRSIADHAAALPPAPGFVERMMAIDTLHYLPGDILVKVDRASMAVGLETRVPFLAPELVTLAWRLPLTVKVRGGDGKAVLRDVLARYVPPALFERPKMGFGVPIGEWLRGPLRGWAEHLLDTRRLGEGGVFDAAEVQRAWKAHQSGSENLQYALWGILMFEAWRERWPYVDVV